ncbi:acyl-homoserine-lactone synthase [Cereibacter changlensis]|nr:acyl-homoserine-lactone synthase [Cereibacter changlensis]
MQVEVVEFGRVAARWDLVEAFLSHRREVFVDRLGWDLTLSEGYEYDQYDVVSVAIYVIAHDGGRILGGARLLRCNSSIGNGRTVYSYMIRDAWRGVIGIPKTVCWEPPTTSPNSWELTRLLTLDPSPRIVRGILHAVNDFLRSRHAKECLFLGPPSFMRMARMFGYAPSAMGDLVENKDGRFIAFSCPVIDRRPHGAPQTGHTHRECLAIV